MAKSSGTTSGISESYFKEHQKSALLCQIVLLELVEGTGPPWNDKLSPVLINQTGLNAEY